MTDRHQADMESKEYKEFNRYIYSMGLSVRATNVILKKCSSLADLTSLDQDSLYAWKNCGRKTVREIIGFLETIQEEGDILLPLSTKEQLAETPKE